MAFRKPRNINEVLSGQLQSRVITADIPVPPGVTIYVTDSNNGRYRPNIKTVTVPVWAYNHAIKKTNDDPEYAIYYVAHELAHAWVDHDGGKDDSPHGRKFYAWFKKLCPPHLWHYEIEYKPRDAKRAGIDPSPGINEAVARADGNPKATSVPPVQLAAGPTTDVSQLRKDAIATDPRLKTKLANVRDDDVKSYVRGWFQL